jgi:hypothetical protein
MMVLGPKHAVQRQRRKCCALERIRENPIRFYLISFSTLSSDWSGTVASLGSCCLVPDVFMLIFAVAVQKVVYMSQ